MYLIKFDIINFFLLKHLSVCVQHFCFQTIITQKAFMYQNFKWSRKNRFDFEVKGYIIYILLWKNPCFRAIF